MSDCPPVLSTHHSYWTPKPLARRCDKLAGIHKTEIAIIGGGIAGLSTGIELLERGHRVTVLEALVIGGGTTGASTGHLDAHPEHGAMKLIAAMGQEKASQLIGLRLEAIDVVANRSTRESEFKRIPAYQYSENKKDDDFLRDEFDAVKKLGLQAEWSSKVPLPYDALGYTVKHFGRINSMVYLETLFQLFQEKGGKIFEESLVKSAAEDDARELEAGDGKIQFENLVYATHSNCIDVMRIYLQTPAYQSYVLAARVKNPCADGLFWDNREPYFYTRLANSHDPNLIIVGGCDHRTGVGDTLEAKQALEKYLYEHYEVEEIVSSWSAELYEPVDGLPLIGKVPAKKNVWIATGFSGIGLTWGTAAAKMIANQIDGKQTPLESELSPSRLGMGGLLTMVGEQSTAASNFAERVLPASKVDVSKLQPGQGAVGDVDGKFVAVCRDQSGNLQFHNPRCVHMGGVVHWNGAEQTWDCPVHGGRYAACGARIYGPPETALEEPNGGSSELPSSPS